jgi:hypothetical protein
LTDTDDRVVWRCMFRAGHEYARLREERSGWRLDGVAVFVDRDSPCRLDYEIECNTDWSTRRATVTGSVGDRTVECDVTVTDDRGWLLNGVECPSVGGCIDVDLNFSPVTNLLPIRRCAPEIGAEVAVTAAWLRFPSFELEPLEQTYRRIAELTYRYTSGGGAFTADVVVNRLGMVISYEGGWVRE